MIRSEVWLADSPSADHFQTQTNEIDVLHQAVIIRMAQSN